MPVPLALCGLQLPIFFASSVESVAPVRGQGVSPPRTNYDPSLHQWPKRASAQVPDTFDIQPQSNLFERKTRGRFENIHNASLDLAQTTRVTRRTPTQPWR